MVAAALASWVVSGAVFHLTVAAAPVAPARVTVKVIASPSVALASAIAKLGALVIENVPSLSVPAAPPPNPMPEFASKSASPMLTVSAVTSVSLSRRAVTVSVTSEAVFPIIGPVKVTVGISDSFRSLHTTPLGSVIGQVVM